MAETVMFPTPTAGSGELLPAYRKERDEQGLRRPNFRVACGVCGFRGANLSKHSHGDGTQDGNGGLGTVSSGNQARRTGLGCPLCGSTNYYQTRRYDPYNKISPFTNRQA